MRLRSPICITTNLENRFQTALKSIRLWCSITDDLFVYLAKNVSSSLASCGKQEEFVFKKEYEDFVDWNYRYRERQGKRPKVDHFEPVDDEGFTFVEYKTGRRSKYINGLENLIFLFVIKKRLFEFYAPKTGLNSGKTEHSRALLE